MGKVVAPTAASQLEDELQHRVRRYELLFKATNDVLYELDLDTGEVSWNEALYEAYGYKPDEPVNTIEWWSSHIHPDDALRIENELSDWLESNENTWQSEYRFLRADGNYNDIRDRGFVLRNADGTPERIIGSFLDISHQRQLDQAKDEFISLVSHQLRTPLTVIRMYSEMLTSGMLGELETSQRQHISRIASASVRMIKLVGDILNVSRIELDRVHFDVQRLGINKLIRECIAEVQPVADEREVSINFKPDPSIRLVPLDGTLFCQILHNLLTNAIRYSKPRGGQVTVTLIRNMDGGYILSVSDNGIGIPKDAQKHIFDRFYRAHNALNIEEHGTGLGLYLVKLLTDAFGGKIWFTSATNRGTTFYLHIPETGMQPTRRHSSIH